MSKKIVAIVGLAAAIAVSTGVITFTSGHKRGTDGDPVGRETASYTADATEEPYDGVDQDDYDNTDPVDFTASEDVTEGQPAADPGGDVNGYSDDIVSVESYNISRIVDHTTGAEVTAREVFGKLYYYCYLAFRSDGSFEMCLNPVADELRTGTYKIYGDVISVEYSDGAGSEFDVISDSSGGIDYIVVSYGDYDVYFG